ncbi:DUF6503 family protein [Kordia jejudonensis]|uniref:DUF6503 family protein n=1 Tax=Kordia jejudonensis TaxID=1348245 RepID=UPI00062958EF|nr:DUF6503 family protein [Kordia jejudonensis]
MKPIQLFLAFVLSIFLVACDAKEKSTSNSETPTSVEESAQAETTKTVDKATKIIEETIQSHGGELYDEANYQFVFRDKTYRFKNDGNSYVYEVESTKDGKIIRDVLDNGKFSRTINNKSVELSEKNTTSAIGAVNSVIYFATLPHKLKDTSVNTSFVEETTIKNQTYNVIKVTFSQEGGGEDFEDEYHYWINKTTKKVDYLAYNYQVNGGGVRFRSAYNVRVVDGITFQDYINYKAPVGTPLKELPALYEKGKLKELSKIETQQIINLKQ